MKNFTNKTGKNGPDLPFMQQRSVTEGCLVVDNVETGAVFTQTKGSDVAQTINPLMPAGRTERKKILKYPFIALASMVLMFFTLTACEKPNVNDTIQLQGNDTIQLQGTKWKLAGIVDVQTNELTVLEPANCTECYTLTFDTDSTMSGHSSANDLILEMVTMSGDSSVSNPVLNLCKISRIGMITKINERGDGSLYLRVLYYVHSYLQEDSNLKFFYTKDNKESYLLFKSI
jgi:hypothetical protein